jgi:hypothetical protein
MSAAPDPVVVALTAGYLRPTAAWGRVGSDVRISVAGLGDLNHVSLHVIGAPQGVVVRAVCACGGRSEILVDGRPFIDPSSLDEDRASEVAATEPAIRHLADVWMSRHVRCTTLAPLGPVPPPLADTVLRHLVDAATALCAGWSISSCMGLELLDDQGRSSMVTAIGDIADGGVYSDQARREWLALQLWIPRSSAPTEYRGRGSGVPCSRCA